MSKDKHYSDTLQRILQGAKFRRKYSQFTSSYIYQIEDSELGYELYKYTKDCSARGFQGYVEKYQTASSTLTVSSTILGKGVSVSINVETDIELISE